MAPVVLMRSAVSNGMVFKVIANARRDAEPPEHLPPSARITLFKTSVKSRAVQLQNPEQSTEVVIIGAGMAGLTAAAELRRANVPFVPHQEYAALWASVIFS
jgi:NADPH-dependent 2,4-dienoyl-CoA reductase/sulfur reductase-like enzyme